jgi:hypothetical protein
VLLFRIEDADDMASKLLDVISHSLVIGGAAIGSGVVHEA